jgi:predicted ATPase/DNA-binding winged helix-turn-helix (wHTH) protein
MVAVPEPSLAVEFRRFQIVRDRRELLADGQPIELGGRAFDTLVALIDARGTVLGKDELMSRVWPDRVVEENNLAAQISTLRKAFGADRDLIQTVAGRGYQFTGEVRKASAAARLLRRSGNLPEPLSELIGRETAMAEVKGLVAAHGLVTLTGGGGIGKTRLAVEVARELRPRFADGAWLAELGPLTDPELVPITVAGGLGLTLAEGAPSPERIAAALGTRHVLLVLDNCEHVIESAARVAEALLRGSPRLSVLATSREPLRTQGEHVYRVPPLDLPAEDNSDMEDVLSHGAVKLFIARARAAEPQFAPDVRQAAAQARICRHLDGIPLAIELAAARVASFGVEGIAARIGDRFALLTGGSRTALRRHQTLRATLDWSHDLLPDSERVVLRRLAVFSGGFTLDSAPAVAGSDDLPAAQVVDCLASLVGKSLVSADTSGAVPHYRLLETTRAYALEKLTESSEFARVARRHAEYYRDLFERAGAEWEIRPTTEWLEDYRRWIDNVRGALDWAFSPVGDAAVGVALTVASLPLWFQNSLTVECRRRVERALAGLEPGSNRNARHEVRLYAALGWSWMYSAGPVRETGAAWTRALELAERLADTEYQLGAIWGLWVYRLETGEHEAAQALAQRFLSVAENSADPADLLVGDRLIGASLHYRGDQARARHHTERMLARYVAPVRRSHVIRFRFDQRVLAQCTLARILWLQGLPDQAIGTARHDAEEARALDHVPSLCHALAAAVCPLALLSGDLAGAERSAATLLDHSASHGLVVWHAWARCFNAALLIKRGDTPAGLRILGAVLDEHRSGGFPMYYIPFPAVVAEALGMVGESAQALAAIDETIDRAERIEEGWCLAELLRIKGEIIRSENFLQKALDCARGQGALSWELRCATSLARLWQQEGRLSAARKLLSTVYRRFTEGFATTDLMTAKTLLEALR